MSDGTSAHLLGVSTARGDFERSLAVEVIRALQVAAIDEMSAGPFLALVAVEDAVTMQGPPVGRKERA